ncbi:MAG: BPTI/Kunitz domain-containing protein [Crocinitomicaceae bacterium]
MKNAIFYLVAALVSFTTGCIKCNEPIPACELEPDSGPCEAYIPKYYYDSASGECKEFIWGGCDGTVPFDTMEECESCIGLK